MIPARPLADLPKLLRQFRLDVDVAGSRMPWATDWPLDRLMAAAADEIEQRRIVAAERASARPLADLLKTLIAKWRADVAGPFVGTASQIVVEAVQQCADELNALLAAEGAARRPPEGWQPIESAPKNQDVLVVYMTGDSIDHVTIGALIDGRWCSEYGRVRPTVWMPLPAAPVAAEGPRHHEETKTDDLSRVEAGATIPPTGSTAQTATGDK